MKSIKKINFSKNLSKIIIAFLLLHFILQFGFLLLEFSAGMQHFDNPDNNALETKSKIYFGIYTVLSFPLLFIADRIVPVNFLPGFFGYLPLVLNSALWSLGFYFLIRKKRDSVH